LSHASSSSDPFYEGLGTAALNVYVSVVYDATNPQRVSSAIYANMLNSLSVTFDMATTVPSMTNLGIFDCTIGGQ
jgi:hypothetical protein